MASFSFLSGSRRKYILIALAVVLCLCVAFLLPILTDPYDCRMAEGTSIGGFDVSGMTKREARDALQSALDERLLSQNLTISLPRETITLTPDQLVSKTDVPAAVKDAYRNGRSDTPGGELALLNYVTLNEALIRDALYGYAAKYDTEFTPTDYHLEGDAPALTTDAFDEAAPCQTLVITLGVPKVQLDVDQLYEQIITTCDNVLREPNAYAIALTEIAPLEEPEPIHIPEIYAELAQEAVNDTLDMENFTFVNGSYGQIFDVAQAESQVAAAAPGETVRIPMEYAIPEVLGDQVYFQDVLGHCETRHTDDVNRNTNLGLLCASLDGVILQPGEEFSYNGTIGERTPERGYKPANAYSGTRVVKDYGGGVCQGSTTLYNCVLLADLEVLERNCHGATVGYVPLGLDAAVNWNTKTDLRFRNNFHFPIMLKAEVSDGYVRMQILGTDEKDYYIEMRTGSSSDDTVIYAVSYKCKYDKETGELLSKDLEARSSYYPLS